MLLQCSEISKTLKLDTLGFKTRPWLSSAVRNWEFIKPQLFKIGATIPTWLGFAGVNKGNVQSESPVIGSDYYDFLSFHFSILFSTDKADAWFFLYGCLEAEEYKFDKDKT